MQNLDTWEVYSAAIAADRLPLGRAYTPTHEERMIREFILQLKRGSVRPSYFREKYGIDPLQHFTGALASLKADGFLAQIDQDVITLNREGLLRVDVLLQRFFLPQHSGIRYT
jgi:oxygen-independent coproporphyrinogen-3 oxidase